ncbi:helix-turn-helix domain-containing protein [Rhizobium leguminosarum]|uniref:helix-turn-helix domain-containing protein n=1 Tax=Rhizobium leguminosarum TaxID=384 RepID=UPI001C903011|nr:AraC family transcriptional regulator [Rhizobium leguminosarum]MBY2973095.1 helix-turn-helix transcriptional regulator [Rhizobium leguminosarum]MBY2980495.1 helix-turn-helix transcriptional regulator [Rhizobium leguminosarum]MBY3009046.1 helix-turn-helix transcriptional regulator [Rhizobium leguminosarum]
MIGDDRNRSLPARATPARESGRLGTGAEIGTVLGSKYELGGSRLLNSSIDLGWRSSVTAEVRRHEDLHCAPFVQQVNEVIIALSGSAQIRRRADGAEQKFLSRPGSACICPRGVAVKYLHIHAGSLDMLHLYLPQDLFGNLACLDNSPIDSGLMYTGGFYDPLVQQIGVAIAEEMQTAGSTGRILLDSLGVALAARMLQNYMRQDSNSFTDVYLDGKSAGGLDRTRLNRVLEFMSQNIDADISLEELASVACLSVYHFARAFKLATGSAPFHYFTDLRLSRAKALLIDPGKTVEDVAFSTGFSSGTNFARAFKKSVGVSPTRFRNDR